MADSTWPDEQLIAAAQGGDAGSIAALVSSSHPHVRRFAHTLCASPEDAEDAAQEALTSGWSPMRSASASPR